MQGSTEGVTLSLHQEAIEVLAHFVQFSQLQCRSLLLPGLGFRSRDPQMKTTRNAEVPVGVGKEGREPIHELCACADASLRFFSVDPTPRPLHLAYTQHAV